jgi:hypothetical protein
MPTSSLRCCAPDDARTCFDINFPSAPNRDNGSRPRPSTPPYSGSPIPRFGEVHQRQSAGRDGVRLACRSRVLGVRGPAPSRGSPAMDQGPTYMCPRRSLAPLVAARCPILLEGSSLESLAGAYTGGCPWLFGKLHRQDGREPYRLCYLGLSLRLVSSGRTSAKRPAESNGTRRHNRAATQPRGKVKASSAASSLTSAPREVKDEGAARVSSAKDCPQNDQRS